MLQAIRKEFRTIIEKYKMKSRKLNKVVFPGEKSFKKTGATVVSNMNYLF